MTLEEFKAKNKPKYQSKLNKYNDEIMDLYESNLSQKTIVAFLKSKNIEVTQQCVSKHIKKLLEKSEDKNKTAPEVKTVEKKVQKKIENDEKKKENITDKKPLFNIPKNVGIDTDIKDARKEHPELFDD